MTHRLLALVSMVALSACVPATALADGDPASDILLRQDAFYPYNPPTARELTRGLDGVLQRTRRAGYPMKVALIGAPEDLGAYAAMFAQPQQYAQLLAKELNTLRHGVADTGPLHLLVVTPTVFAGTGLGDKVDAALAPVSIPAGGQSNGMAQAAMKAVARIATANGHPVPEPPEAKLALASLRGAPSSAPTPRPSKGGGSSVLIFAVPAVLVVLGALLAGRLAARRQTANED